MVQRAQIIIRILLALLFSWFAYLKLNDQKAFQEVLTAYDLFSAKFNIMAVLYVPSLEIVIALTLLIPFAIKAASRALLLLLGIFTAALIPVLYRGIDCGCLGDFAMSPSWAISRNILLFCAALFVAKKFNTPVTCEDV